MSGCHSPTLAPFIPMEPHPYPVVWGPGGLEKEVTGMSSKWQSHH